MNSRTATTAAEPQRMPSALDHWQPALCSGGLRRKPMRLTLHGLNFVAWRDDHGTAHVQPDRCPHRGMSLSLGKVTDGCLVCPYHGWTFDAAGFATSSGTPKMTLRANAMETREREGVIWI